MPSFDGRLWQLLALSLGIILVLTGGTYIYWRINTPPSPTLRVTASYPPLELSMNLSKTEYVRNETIDVSLFLTNKGNEPIFLSFTYFNGHVSLIVRDENDTDVYAYPNFYLMLVDNIVLEPGEQITAPWDDPTQWNQRGNLPGKYYNKLVPLGTYKIIGRTGRVSFMGGPESGIIETPPITVTID